jgi:type I restriction enzyme, S subunit
VTLVVPLEEIFANEVGLLAKDPSWTRIELGEVCTIVNGFPFKSTNFTKEKGFPVVRIRDLTTGQTETFFDGDVPPESIINDGDLLIGMDGNFRCVEWRGGTAGLNQRVCKIIPDKRILHPRFLLHGINGYLKAIQDATSSVTVGHLSSRDVLLIPFPLPPLAEQRRIVAKLEELLGRVSRAKTRLDRIPALLKRFRQSVLAAACSGKLTADWREENPCESLEKLLLASLRGNKKLYEALQNDSRFKSSTPFDWDMFPTIDTTWSWASAAEVVQPGSEIVYGIVQPGPEVSDGIPYVRGMDIQDGRILIHQLKRTSREIAERYERASLKCGDVLLGIIRNTKVAIVPEQLSGGNITQGTARFRPSEFVSTGFLALWLTSKYAQDWLHMHYRGIDMPGLNLADVRKLPVPLPPIVEQLEIERRVEQLFAFADQIEARLTRAQAQVDRLTQSILAKAFRGELVPTEAELARRESRDYEPASKLLERVRIEATSMGSTQRKKGRKENKKEDRVGPPSK